MQRRRRVLSHTPPRPQRPHRPSSLSNPLIPLYHSSHQHYHRAITPASRTFRMEMTTTTNDSNGNNNLHHHNSMATISVNGHDDDDSSNFDNDLRNPEEPIPTFAFSEIRLGRMVGRGGFSVVNEVERIVLDEVYDTSDEETARRQRLALSPHFSNQRFVLKTLRTDLPEDEHVKGICDLAIEADFLSKLSHVHIITMRAMANSDPHESKFFVILDRLVMTLDRKFNAWRKQIGENSGIWLGPCCGYCCAKRPVLYHIWLERLSVARDIAHALSYLHSQSICYRDLKPDNCGFNAKGQLKLFDFGLAKRMDPHDRTIHGVYNMTGNTGSLRYMAPEVANCEPYDQRCDAYSFGILFWQICSLTTPFAGFSLNMHAERVVRLGHRPKPDSTWPTSWVNVMMECWSTDVTARPSMEVVMSILAQEVVEMEQDEGMMLPTRASEKIRAKQRKRKKLQRPNQLDVDTRLATTTGAADAVPLASLSAVVEDDGGIAKRFDNHIV